MAQSLIVTEFSRISAKISLLWQKIVSKANINVVCYNKTNSIDREGETPRAGWMKLHVLWCICHFLVLPIWCTTWSSPQIQTPFSFVLLTQLSSSQRHCNEIYHNIICFVLYSHIRTGRWWCLVEEIQWSSFFPHWHFWPALFGWRGVQAMFNWHPVFCSWVARYDFVF